jgi:hypothetical protein
VACEHTSCFFVDANLWSVEALTKRHCVVCNVSFRLWASFFLLLSQKKETKEKATPLPLYPSFLAPHLGGCGTRAFSTQTVLATCPSAAQAEGAAKGI